MELESDELEGVEGRERSCPSSMRRGWYGPGELGLLGVGGGGGVLRFFGGTMICVGVRMGIGLLLLNLADWPTLDEVTLESGDGLDGELGVYGEIERMESVRTRGGRGGGRRD